MSFWSTVSNIFRTTETDVVDLIAQIKKDVEIAASDVNNALKWIAGNVPAIAADVQTASSLIEQVGITNPTVIAAIKAANESVQALNAFASAENAGQSNPQAVVAGYVALKSAVAASASAAAAAAKA